MGRTTMSERAADFDALVKRVDTLERHNRWLRRGVLGVLLLGGALLAIGQPGQAHQPEEVPVHKTLAVQNLVFVDGNGKRGGFLTTMNGGTSLVLHGLVDTHDSKWNAQLVLDKNGIKLL